MPEPLPLKYRWSHGPFYHPVIVIDGIYVHYMCSVRN